jgi:transcriptional regulator with XRE-family HTH domain
MEGIGARLRMIRRQSHLSLREVEERSRRIAQERGDSSYQVSAGSLARLERYGHGFTVNRLVTLAEIYKITLGQLLRAEHPRNEGTQNPDHLSSPNETESSTKRLRKDPVRHSRAARPLPDLLPDETTLLPLPIENGPSRTPYLRAVIGKRDLTLSPIIPAGSIVHVDTRKREIASKQNWPHELQRRIHLLKAEDTYFCGWCELDEGSHLTLIPHPLSSAPSRIWKYGSEVENLGRVMSVVIRSQSELDQLM